MRSGIITQSLIRRIVNVLRPRTRLAYRDFGVVKTAGPTNQRAAYVLLGLLRRNITAWRFLGGVGLAVLPVVAFCEAKTSTNGASLFVLCWLVDYGCLVCLEKIYCQGMTKILCKGWIIYIGVVYCRPNTDAAEKYRWLGEYVATPFNIFYKFIFD